MIGLLIAQSETEKTNAVAAGYGLLRYDRGGFIVTDLRGQDLLDGQRFLPERDDWPMCPNMVINQAQFSGGLANRSGDSAVVFHPSGEIYIYEDLQVAGSDPARDADLVLLDIIKRYFPAAHLTH